MYLYVMRHKIPHVYNSFLDSNFIYTTVSQYGSDIVDEYPKSLLSGVRDLKELLAKGNNQRSDIFRNPNEGNRSDLQRDIIRFGNSYREDINPMPTTIGDFIRSYIERVVIVN